MSLLKYNNKDINSILSYSRKLVGKSIGEISDEILVPFGSNKGGVGQYIEKHYFGIKNNSLQEPDFIEVGMELKVTPLKRNKHNQLKAKERLVLTMINYENDHCVEFYSSHLYNKIKHVLIVTYLYEKHVDSNDFKIIDSLEYTIPPEDLATIIEDYKIVLKMISEGRAHEISESLTTYLGACTKGANGSSVRIQPNSDIPAKQRAWSFKPSYMNYFYDKINANSEIVSISEGLDKSLNTIINEKLLSFYGKSEHELLEIFNLSNTSSKNKFQMIASGMFGITGTKLDDIAEFKKSNIKLKTVRIQRDGSIKEDMSFETLKYLDIVNEDTFEDSELYQIFGTTSYLILFFREDSNGHYRFEKHERWSLSYDELKEVEKYWEKLKKALSEPIKLQPIQQKDNVIYKYMTLPTSSKDSDFHCRTKGGGKRKPGTYKKIPTSSEVIVLERTFTNDADKNKLLPLDNIPNTGEIHSMCTFVHKRKIKQIYEG